MAPGAAAPGTLNERLAALAHTVRLRFPGRAEVIEHFIGRLHAAGAGAGAPMPGDAMPDFMLPDENGSLVSLASLLRGGPLAVIFHRGHWCMYCRETASAWATAEQAITAAGGRLVAIVPERQSFARTLKQQAAYPYPVLVDMDLGYALSLGLAVWLDAEMQALYADIGYDLPRFYGNEGWMVPIPATFILNARGVIVARHLDPDYRKRMEVEELLEALAQAR